MRNVLADACEDKSFAAHPPQLVALRLDFNWNSSREAILLTQLQWLQLGVHSHDSRKWFQEHLREPLPSGNSRSIPLPVVTALGGTGQLVFDVMILPCQKSKLKFHPKIQRNDGGSREKRVADEHACTGGWGDRISGGTSSDGWSSQHGYYCNFTAAACDEQEDLEIDSEWIHVYTYWLMLLLLLRKK